MDICTKDAEMDTVNLKPEDASTILWNKDNVIHLRLQTEVILLSSESFIL